MIVQKVTAENLHIVRQTQYHRFKKINDVLTFDFDAPENRLNVEMALKVYQLIQAKWRRYVGIERPPSSL